jgi:hypothetical protein
MSSHAKAAIGLKQLVSGNFSDTCPVAATLDELDAAKCACPPLPRHVRCLVELNCGHCSRTIGAAILPDPGSPILVPHNLRCRWCGGQPQPGDIIRQIIYPTLPKMAPPHRGRPPRWLVEQRRRESA